MPKARPVVFDTHVWVDLFTKLLRPKAATMARIRAAQLRHEVLIPPVALWEIATAESAREIADRTWDLVHDRPDSDPVKRRVVECHEALARMTRLGD